MAKKKQATVTPLTGKDLLNKLKEVSHLSKTEKAKECGYENKGRAKLGAFMNAILEAQGITLETPTEGKGKGGRNKSYRIAVQKNGNILVGSAYTELMGLKTGDEFEIKVGRKQIQLKLVES